MAEAFGADIPVWQMLVFFAILPGIFEEIAFRGVLLHGLKSRLKPVQLVLVAGIAFGFFHVDLFRIPGTSLLGVLLVIAVLAIRLDLPPPWPGTPSTTPRPWAAPASNRSGSPDQPTWWHYRPRPRRNPPRLPTDAAEPPTGRVIQPAADRRGGSQGARGQRLPSLSINQLPWRSAADRSEPPQPLMPPPRGGERPLGPLPSGSLPAANRPSIDARDRGGRGRRPSASCRPERRGNGGGPRFSFWRMYQRSSRSRDSRIRPRVRPGPGAARRPCQPRCRCR